MSVALVLVAVGGTETVVARQAIWVLRVEGGADSCRRRSVAVAGDVSAGKRHGGLGWRRGRVGDELSSRIAGKGRRRGSQPGSKVSTTIMRPPQQGQALHSSSF